jgi:hypothetical protein
MKLPNGQTIPRNENVTRMTRAVPSARGSIGGRAIAFQSLPGGKALMTAPRAYRAAPVKLEAAEQPKIQAKVKLAPVTRRSLGDLKTAQNNAYQAAVSMARKAKRAEDHRLKLEQEISCKAERVANKAWRKLTCSDHLRASDDGMPLPPDWDD